MQFLGHCRIGQTTLPLLGALLSLAVSQPVAAKDPFPRDYRQLEPIIRRVCMEEHQRFINDMEAAAPDLLAMLRHLHGQIDAADYARVRGHHAAIRNAYDSEFKAAYDAVDEHVNAIYAEFEARDERRETLLRQALQYPADSPRWEELVREAATLDDPLHAAHEAAKDRSRGPWADFELARSNLAGHWHNLLGAQFDALFSAGLRNRARLLPELTAITGSDGVTFSMPQAAPDYEDILSVIDYKRRFLPTLMENALQVGANFPTHDGGRITVFADLRTLGGKPYFFVCQGGKFDIESGRCLAPMDIGEGAMQLVLAREREIASEHPESASGLCRGFFAENKDVYETEYIGNAPEFLDEGFQTKGEYQTPPSVVDLRAGTAQKGN